MKITTNFIKQTKRHLSASGSILLPLALKWRLMGLLTSGILAIFVLPCVFTSIVSAASITLKLPEKLSLAVQPDGELHTQQSGAIQITSDASAGYTFSIKSNDNTNTLKNGDRTIPSITAETEDNGFAVNHWGFKWSKKGGPTSIKYQPGPTTGTELDKTDQANEIENEYTVTLGVKVDSNTPAGAYSNTFILMATANDVPYTITYDGNGDGVTNVPKQMSGSAAEGNMVQIGTSASRQNYVFMGWCDQKTVDETCDGQIYQPESKYKLVNGRNSLTLYAMWARIMQNWDGCISLEKNKQISLIDTRNNRLYYVARLADGNCWMTENLDLDLSTERPLTPQDSDVQEEWTPEKSTYSKDQTAWERNSNGDTHPLSYDPGDKCWKGEQIREVAGYYFDDDSRDCFKHDPSHYHIGNYYNYSAAVAQNDTSSHKNLKEAYDTSICPAGWQLPSYEGAKSYKNLQDKVAVDADSPEWVAGYIGEKPEGSLKENVDTVYAPPYYFTYSGLWNGFGSEDKPATNFGWDVHYQLNAVEDIVFSYSICLSGGGKGKVNTQQHAYRYDGFPVRCVSRQ